ENPAEGAGPRPPNGSASPPPPAAGRRLASPPKSSQSAEPFLETRPSDTRSPGRRTRDDRKLRRDSLLSTAPPVRRGAGEVYWLSLEVPNRGSTHSRTRDRDARRSVPRPLGVFGGLAAPARADR